MNQQIVKLLKFSIAALLMSLIGSSPTQAAYFVGQMSDAPIGIEQPTHFLIAAHGQYLGDLTVAAAAAKGQKLRELYPNDQIVILATRTSRATYGSLQKYGFKNLKPVESWLDFKRAVAYMYAFERIASLSIYSHSTVSSGIWLDGKVGSDNFDHFWDHEESTSRVAEILKYHFTPQAAVTLNGCNGGHALAPELSRIWQVPVSGALTGTHFEGQTPSGAFAISNSPERLCAPGNSNCIRMRPDNELYSGDHGSFKVGINFFKFFCVDVDQDVCLKSIARSVLTLVSTKSLGAQPSLTEYAEVVREWLCPIEVKSQEMQKRCIETLAKIDLFELSPAAAILKYNPFRQGGIVQCSLATCYPRQICADLSVEKCAMSKNIVVNESTTFVDEYLNYIKGYHLLFRDKSGLQELPLQRAT